MTLSIMMFNAHAECRLFCVAIKPNKLGVIVLNVIVLNVIVLNVILLNVILLNVVALEKLYIKHFKTILSFSTQLVRRKACSP